MRFDSHPMASLSKPVLTRSSPASRLGLVIEGGLLDELAAGLEQRIPGAHSHARRVSRFAAGIAQQLDLHPRQVALVRQAAVIHDIGKLETPAELVNRAGLLSDEEFALVQQHSVVGARIATGFGEGDELVAIVRHHHERFDGSGYPDGLAGEEIPLGARIVAVADTFDAVTSERPYRPAMSHCDALALLGAEAGTQLDPDVVHAFMGCYEGLAVLLQVTFGE
jgi:putative nucleotidyltransferase with HDIG domain